MMEFKVFFAPCDNPYKNPVVQVTGDIIDTMHLDDLIKHLGRMEADFVLSELLDTMEDAECVSIIVCNDKRLFARRELSADYWS
jgi:hypothetical protein